MKSIVKIFRVAVLSLVVCNAAMAEKKPLRVYILAGQSNMQGSAHQSTFAAIGDEPSTAYLLQDILDQNGNPVICENAWITYLTQRDQADTVLSGPVKVGYGFDDERIGPEYAFGLYMDRALEEPILIIKTAWGGKSLAVDFRPPSAGPYEPSLVEKQRGNIPEPGEVGHYYREMIRFIRASLGDAESIQKLVPGYQADQGYELSGFVWFQGWNDLCNRHHLEQYTDNMIHFITDVRKEFNRPALPFIVGILGVYGTDPDSRLFDKTLPVTEFRRAQFAAVDQYDQKVDSLYRGHVIGVDSGPFYELELSDIYWKRRLMNEWNDRLAQGKMTPDELRKECQRYGFGDGKLTEAEQDIWDRCASNAEYHYLGSGKTFIRFGKALAEAMLRDREVLAANFWDEIPVSPSTTPPDSIYDDYWYSQFLRVNREIAESENPQLVFFGNSITWMWSLGGATGKDIWQKKYASYHPINMGNSGDITPVMLYRLTHGNLNFAVNSQPKVAVLLCGTNNFVVTQSAGGTVHWDLGASCRPEDVAHGARAVAQVFRRQLPQTRVILMGILPVSDTTKWAKCQEVNAINAAFAYNQNEVVFLDLQDKFLNADGSLNQELFTDGTHLTEKGYQVWAKAIDAMLTGMMKAEDLQPVKIMLVGGSITEGVNSDGAYRRYLDGMLRREGMLIDFIGSRNRHNNNQTEPVSYQFDADHEGHWGKDSEWLAKNMPDLLDQSIPDVVVIHMGTEDIIAGAGPAGSLTDAIIGHINQVTEALRAKNRRVKIVLANIIPLKGKTDEVELLNLKISQYVEAHSTTESPMVLADQYAGFDPSALLMDNGAMPNAAGAKKMARIFADVLIGGHMLEK